MPSVNPTIAKQTSKILISRWESRRALTWNLAEILGELFAAEILRSPEILARVSVRISASFWPPRFWDLGENLGEFLAAEIARSRRDLAKISAILPAKNSLRFSVRSRWDLGQNFARVYLFFLGAFSDSNAGFPQWRGLAETLGKLIQPALLTALGLLLKARWQS